MFVYFLTSKFFLLNHSNILEQQFREHFRAKWSLWAAVGAGCLVGVSGLLLMQRLSLRVDHSVCVASSGAGSNVSKELASLHSTLKELRQEIQELRAKPLLKYIKNEISFSLNRPSMFWKHFFDSVVHFIILSDQRYEHQL